MPIVAPANVAEYLEFGLYGWALSRFSGNWVGFTALSEVVESGGTVDLDETARARRRLAAAADVEAPTGHAAPGRRAALPLARPAVAEDRGARCSHKLDAVRAFARINSIDREIVAAPQATVGIVTCGKAHYDLIEVFRRLDIPLDALAAAGRAALQGRPVVSARADAHATAFAAGLEEILVIEEKAGVVETQLRDLFYNAAVRPRDRRQARRRRAGR